MSCSVGHRHSLDLEQASDYGSDSAAPSLGTSRSSPKKKKKKNSVSLRFLLNLDTHLISSTPPSIPGISSEKLSDIPSRNSPGIS